MKTEFNEIIETLLRDKMYAITVEHKDAMDNWARIECNANAAMLEEKYTSVGAFFEKLHASGTNQLRITPRRQNGSNPSKGTINYKAAGEPIVITMSAKQDQPHAPVVAAPIAPAVPAAAVHALPLYPPALAAPGLGGGHLTGDAAYKYFDHGRLVNENQRLSTDNERQKKEIDELKDTIRENKFSTEKAKNNNDLVATVSPLLAPILERLMTPPGAMAMPGLGQPEPQFAPAKQHFIDVLKRTDDGFVADLALVAKGMTDSQAFDEEIQQLFIKYNLIQQSHAS